MPAERSRASRIRSPSWQNELINKVIRQKARLRRAFLLCSHAVPQTTADEILAPPVFLLAAILPHLKPGARSWIVIALCRRDGAVFAFDRAMSRGVTLKKNLEKLHLTNHLSP
jgi:hypothetical protein